MKRAGLAISLYLLLGLATSVAVAWSLAALPLASGEWVREHQGRMKHWMVFDAHRLGATAWSAQVLSRPSDGEELAWLAPWSVISETAPSRREFVIGEPIDHLSCIVEKQFGWPWTYLGFSVIDVDREGDMDSPRIVGGIPVRLLDHDDVRVPGARVATTDPLFAARALPLRADVQRLIANVFFWSAVWFALFTPKWAPRAVRMRYRLGHGRCGPCGYDLRETTGGRCSECGAAVGIVCPAISPRHLKTLTALTVGFALLVVAGAMMARWTRGGVRPIHIAGREGDLHQLDRLLRSGVETDSPVTAHDSRDFIHGTTPLMWAAAYDEVEAIETLLGSGADLTATDGRGWTALMWAAHYDRRGALQSLIAHGAEVNAQNARGETALIIACRDNSPQCAAVLIEAGAALDIVSRDGSAMTFAATFASRLPILRMLIDAGAEVEPPLFRARSPLHWAMGARNVDGVRVLLKAGADPLRPTHQGFTVLQHAESEEPIGMDDEIWKEEELRQIIDLFKAALRERGQ